MNEEEKARVYDLYDEGEMTETAARELLGDAEFESAERMTKGAENLLDEDPAKFLSE